MSDEHIKFKGIQRQIANKMVESKRKIPHVTTIREVNMEKVLDKKNRLNADNQTETAKYSLMTFIIYAVLEAMKSFRIINSSLDEENNEIIIHENKNIGFAVSINQKLVVPVIKNTKKYNFTELNKEVNKVIKKARNKKLTSKDFKDGTFTISNSGAFGGEIFNSIISYPQSSILGIGRIKKKPIVEDEEIIIKPMMYLCLSYDHRIINGAEAVQFLGELEKTLNSANKFL